MERTLTGWARDVLDAATLEGKLVPPTRAGAGDAAGDALLPDPVASRGGPLVRDEPVRAGRLALRSGAGRLPKPARLGERDARIECLHRFAHHELMAVELFAWALLTWPELPDALRRGMARVAADEQRHCRMLVERLEAHGARFGDRPLSAYLWRHVAAIRESPRGPLAFLCAMGLTFEQANLDFAGTWAQGFRAAGDEESALALERIHADEEGHVRLAAEWLERLKEPGESDVEAYESAVPFPLSAARAKGRRFDAEARRRAGLSEAMIAHVREARSSSEVAGGKRAASRTLGPSGER